MVWKNIKFAMKVRLIHPHRFIKGVERMNSLFLLFNIQIQKFIYTFILDIKGEQRDINEGFEGVQRGLPLPTPSKPPRCPLDGPSIPPLNYEQMTEKKNGVNRYLNKLKPVIKIVYKKRMAGLFISTQMPERMICLPSNIRL